MSRPSELDVIIDMTALNTPSRQRGIGRYVASLCHALAHTSEERRGLRVAGLVRHMGSPTGAIDPTFGFSGDAELEVTSLRYQRHKMERRFFLGTLARATGARLLHLPDPPGTPIDMRLGRVVTCHDLIPLLLHQQYLRVPGMRAVQFARDFARYRTARRVIAVSQSTKNDLIEHLGVEPGIVDVVYHGVDHGRFHPNPAPGERDAVARRLGFESPFVLYLGAGDARKGLELLVNAYPRSRLAANMPLVVAGPLSPTQRARLLSIAAAEGVELRLLGYVDDDIVPALYRACHLHVFPSAYEGFGLPVLEALACGAPTITTNASSLGEVAGDAALTLESRAVEELAAAIDRLGGDTELRALLEERGLRHARTFTWERCAEQTLASYARALP